LNSSNCTLGDALKKPVTTINTTITEVSLSKEEVK